MYIFITYMRGFAPLVNTSLFKLKFQFFPNPLRIPWTTKVVEKIVEITKNTLA